MSVEIGAFTITEFCRRNRMSAPTYFKLRKAGLGPKEMRLRSWVRISATAEKEWQRARENPTGAEANAVERAHSAVSTSECGR